MATNRRKLALGLAGSALGTLVGATTVAAEAASPASAEIPRQHPGPFADVELAHPVYAALQWFAQMGFVIGYPDGAFSGKQTRTRYEFAVAVQRLEAGLARGLESARARNFRELPLPGGEPLARSDRMLNSPEGRRSATVWMRALVSEFRRELAMLGSDAEALLVRLSAREDEAAAASIHAAEHSQLLGGN